MNVEKIEWIKQIILELYDVKVECIDNELVNLILSKGYEHKCSVQDLKCENCIFSWLITKKRESLFQQHYPFPNYKAILSFYKKYSLYFDLGTMYKMNDEYTLSVIPNTIEEASLYSPELITYYENYNRKLLSKGNKNYFECPILIYEDLISEFNRKHKISPIPKEFIRIEKEWVTAIVSNLKYSMKKSYETEYNAIINSEEVIYDIDSKEYPSKRFLLRSYTYPIAKYMIFLEKIKDFYPADVDLDDELKKIEINLRGLILELLKIDSLIKLKQSVNGFIIESIEKRIKSEESAEFQRTKTKINNPKYWLDMSDLTDLERIISQKNNWPTFKSVFGNKDTFQDEFKSMCDLRNGIRHVRDLSEIVILKGKASILWFNQQFNESRTVTSDDENHDC